MSRAPGEAKRLARAAVEDGACLVAACGGDGTVVEVSHSLIGTKVPLAILPAGTVNVMAAELGIPRDIKAACTLVCDGICNGRRRIVEVDVGQISSDTFFLTGLGVGLGAQIVGRTSGDGKRFAGRLAYMWSAVRTWRQIKPSRYRLRLDGEEVDTEGVACLICNVGSIGIRSLRLSPQTSVSDGLLDVFVLKQARPATLARAFYAMLSTREPEMAGVRHWQAREVDLRVSPHQAAYRDGEPMEDMPLHIGILPRALRCIVGPDCTAGTAGHDQKE